MWARFSSKKQGMVLGIGSTGIPGSDISSLRIAARCSARLASRGLFGSGQSSKLLSEAGWRTINQDFVCMCVYGGFVLATKPRILDRHIAKGEGHRATSTTDQGATRSLTVGRDGGHGRLRGIDNKSKRFQHVNLTMTGKKIVWCIP